MGLPSGVIHADLFPDNVFFDDASNLSGVFDFYFACKDAFVYDIAICLNAWCFDSVGKFSGERAGALLSHYRPLNSAERRALPILAGAQRFAFS